MDLFNDHSDSVESQPTQLLQHALTKATKIVEHSTEWGLNQQREQEEDGDNINKDFSTESLIIPPVRGSTSQYQFHWLAPTQSQPQVLHREQEIVGEGQDSQKENTPASNQNIMHESIARTRSPSPQTSSAKPIKGSHADSLNPRTASGIGKAKAPMSVSFSSPRSARIAQPLLQPTKSLPVVPRRRQRSLSPASQDSFGGAVSQDPAANYIAQATQVFEVPLSDLGHTANDLTMDDRAAHSPNSQEDENDSWMDKMRRAYEKSKSSEASGSVLVADTPSQSDASQESSRNISFPHPDASQLLNDESSPESEAQRGRYRSQTNASQSSLLVAEDEPTAEKITVAIPEQLVPTQPSTPPENTFDPALAEVRSLSARATVGTTSTPGPRSLLSLIHPDQRARRLRQLYDNDIISQAPSASNAARQPSEPVQTPYKHDETQPSTFVTVHPSNLLPEDNDVPLPIPKQLTPLHHELPQPRARSIPQRFDNLDIVPDSDPPAPSTATPARELRLGQNPTKRPFRPLSPMSEHDSGEIVPDSVEVPESSQDLEGDVPLAVLLQVKSGKSAAELAMGKMRSSRRSPSLPPPAVLVKKANPSTTKPKSLARGKKNVKQESGEIPTSAPEQDLQDPTPIPERMATPTVVPPVKKGGRKGKAPAVPIRKSTRTRAAPPATGRKRPHSSDTEASDEWSCQGETRPTSKAAKQEEEELTDDEDYADADPVVLKATSSRKRKCTEDVKPSRAVSKASTRSKTPASSTRATKRLRPIVPTSRALTTQSATRVFALWRQDGHYYSGTIHSLQAGTRYLVKFDDDTEDHVDISKLRQCELRVGDAVILGHGDLRGTVVDVSQMESGSVRVEIDDGSDLISSDYDIQDIRVAARAILSHWKDRNLTADHIVTIVRPKSRLLTPSPSKMSLMSATSVKQKKPFTKTGFVVTLTVGNKNPERMKDNVMLAIKHNGGTVIDDWSNIFSMEGVHSQSNKRWTASQENFKFRPKPEFEGLERVFLLADDYNQKPKYLMALALGIPCLSHEWIRDDYTQISLDWQLSLLPAGFSEILSARVSQLVDLDWGNCKEHLSDIMSNMVASKLFSSKTILCLGADFVPLPPRGGRKGASDVAKESSRIVPWIIICMGASRVEAVTEVKFATKNLSAYDYVVVKDSSERPKDLPKDGLTLFHVPWVKDCLITGRLLPIVDI